MNCHKCGQQIQPGTGGTDRVKVGEAHSSNVGAFLGGGGFFWGSDHTDFYTEVPLCASCYEKKDSDVVMGGVLFICLFLQAILLFRMIFFPGEALEIFMTCVFILALGIVEWAASR